jgi:hypothetical protein
MLQIVMLPGESFDRRIPIFSDNPPWNPVSPRKMFLMVTNRLRPVSGIFRGRGGCAPLPHPVHGFVTEL